MNGDEDVPKPEELRDMVGDLRQPPVHQLIYYRSTRVAAALLALFTVGEILIIMVLLLILIMVR